MARPRRFLSRTSTAGALGLAVLAASALLTRAARALERTQVLTSPPIRTAAYQTKEPDVTVPAPKVDGSIVGMHAYLVDARDPTDAASFKTYLERYLPVAAERRKALVARQPDDDVEAEWDDLIKDYDDGASGAEQALAALEANDETEFRRIVEDARGLDEESEKHLDAFGAPRCGSKSDEA